MNRHKSIGEAIKWLLAVATVLVALLLIWQCADIYRVGMSAANQGANGVRISDIYSREIVGERFGRISWSVWVWLVLFVAALILRSENKKADGFKMKPSDQLKLLLQRKEKTPEMQALEKKNRIAIAISTVVCMVCAIGAISYLVNPSSFASRDLEPVMGQMMIHVVPWVVIAFASAFIAQSICIKNSQAELELAKKASAKEKITVSELQLSKEHAKKQTIARLVVFCVAVILIVAGILNGGMFDVLVKAINICTECIGLG